MSKISKTAKASAVTMPKETATITDEQYIKNLRYDVANGIHATQEGAKALLRAYDSLAVAILAEKAEADALEIKLNAAELALGDKVLENEKLFKRVQELEAEIEKIKDALGLGKPVFGNTSTHQRVLDDPQNEAV